MRLLVQVVKEASVTNKERLLGKIDQGILILFGVGVDDTPQDCEWLAEKMANLRILPDGDGKMNLSIKDTGGQVLIVSQFTLYADCTQGRRPSFISAAPPPQAKELYEQFIAAMKARVPVVQTGNFGDLMQVSLINDGPLTFILDSPTHSN
ncbi:MAG: D-tyrosyl-tRNA(Tyr) deacylase [Verrucomicrobia bacterium]|nr:D-tyrosyl-tRNA(Tyr) deacylase [Verrucomicrobiota bacterium]